MQKIVMGICLALVLTVWSLPVRAEKMYVIDELVITVRKTKSVSGEVVGRARSLDRLEVLETDDSWAKVKGEDGTVGWVQTRYLSQNQPVGLRLKEIKEENGQLAEKVGVLEQENQRLKQLSEDLEKRLANEQAVLEKLETDYKELGENAADYLVLKKEYEEIRNQLTQVKAHSEKLKKAADEKVNSKRIKWFITGGAVLLAGWLVGIFSARRRKSSSSLY